MSGQKQSTTPCPCTNDSNAKLYLMTRNYCNLNAQRAAKCAPNNYSEPRLCPQLPSLPPLPLLFT